MVCRQVNEADNTNAPVEIPKPDDADEAPEDNLPIKREVNGDVEGTTSGGSELEGADLDPADQALVETVSAIQEIDVSGVSAFRLESFSIHFLGLYFWVWGVSTPCLVYSFPLLLLPLSLLFVFVCSFLIFRLAVDVRVFLSRFPVPKPSRRSLSRRVMRFLNPLLVSCSFDRDFESCWLNVERSGSSSSSRGRGRGTFFCGCGARYYFPRGGSPRNRRARA